MIAPERWEQVYRQEFARVYRALLAVLRDPDRALDALQDAFVAGLRKPPAEDDDLAGWLFVVAVRSGRRGLRRRFLGLDHARSRVSKDQVEASLDRMEVGRLLAGLTERQRAMVVAQFYAPTGR
jgi:DNA-directed RNA polymerase specialized sigma24 family protein